MMNLFTERNNMREPISKTSTMARAAYELLIHCCEKYFVNLAKMFPEFCPDDERNICGADIQQIKSILKYRIPNLFKNEYSPHSMIPSEGDEFDQYAALDLIEFVAQNMVTVVNIDYHSFFRHHHIRFTDTEESFDEFQRDINGLFEMLGLNYRLTENKIIERITDADALIEEAREMDSKIPEEGVRQLISEAIVLYQKAKPADNHLATEKIWDALERLKSIYVSSDIDKKRSAEMIIDKVSQGISSFSQLLNEEYLSLTKIGNKFRIRHHEMDKIDIPSDDFYDYFFNRCLSLILLTIKSL